MGVEGKTAADCLALCGGSFLLLERCAGMLRGGAPLSGGCAGGWGGGEAGGAGLGNARACLPRPPTLMPDAEVRARLMDLMELAYLQAGLLDASEQQAEGLGALEALLASADGSMSAAGECVCGERACAPPCGAAGAQSPAPPHHAHTVRTTHA